MLLPSFVQDGRQGAGGGVLCQRRKDVVNQLITVFVSIQPTGKYQDTKYHCELRDDQG